MSASQNVDVAALLKGLQSNNQVNSAKTTGRALLNNGLATPESSLGPDTARNEADKQRATTENNAGAEPTSQSDQQKAIAKDNASAEANQSQGEDQSLIHAQKEEINRILSADPRLPLAILGVENWLKNNLDFNKRLGFSKYKKIALKVHPDKCKLPNAQDAFQKLNSAAEQLGFQDIEPEAPGFVDSDGFKTDEFGNRINRQGKVIKLNEDGLRKDEHGITREAEDREVLFDEDGRTYKIGPDGGVMVFDENDKLIEEINPTAGPMDGVESTPAPAPAQAQALALAQAPAPEQQSGEITAWPWETGHNATGDTIMAYMTKGKGHRVVVASHKDDSLLRIESASDCGLLEFETDRKQSNILKLDSARRKFTYKDRNEFVRLERLATSEHKVHNPHSKSGARRDPDSYYFARFKSGFFVLPSSELRRVLGQKSADAKISHGEAPMDKVPQFIMSKPEALGKAKAQATYSQAHAASDLAPSPTPAQGSNDDKLDQMLQILNLLHAKVANQGAKIEEMEEKLAYYESRDASETIENS